MVIGCIVVLIIVLTVAGVAFAIQLTKDAEAEKALAEGKETVTEEFSWSVTEKGEDGTNDEDRITT